MLVREDGALRGGGDERGDDLRLLARGANAKKRTVRRCGGSRRRFRTRRPFFDEYNAGPGDYAGWTSVRTGSATPVTTISPIRPNDGVDHADDLESLLAAHQGEKLYFPPGNYIIRKYVQFAQNAALDNFGSEIAGAGIWYTRIRGKQAIFFCDVTTTCNVHDLAIWGDSTARDETVNGAQKEGHG